MVRHPCKPQNMDEWEQHTDNYKICVVSASIPGGVIKTSGAPSKPDNFKGTDSCLKAQQVNLTTTVETGKGLCTLDVQGVHSKTQRDGSNLAPIISLANQLKMP